MTSSVQTVEDVCNQALGAIGFPKRIGSVYEGSKAAKAALDVYAQTRDELLRKQAWGFAERNINMVLLKFAPAGGYNPVTPWTTAYPPVPWLFEYQYPLDCLKVRSVKPQPIFIPNFDPQPQVFDVINDNYLSPPAKAVVSNVANAIIVYTGQVTNVTLWEPLFVEALVDALAVKLAPKLGQLTQSGDAAEKEEKPTEAADTFTADINQG